MLVAEDNAVNRKVVASMLEGLGYQVEAVTNGAEAVEACRRSVYDLVLMDRQMPEMDGLRATVLIREQEGPSRRTPSWLDRQRLAGERERCLASGMERLSHKPVRLQVWMPRSEMGAGGRGRGRRRLLGSRPRPPVARWRRNADRMLALEVLDLFLQSTPLRLAEIRSRSSAKTHAAWKNAAHSLKGAAAQMGAGGWRTCARSVVAVCGRPRLPLRASCSTLEAEWRSERLAFEDEAGPAHRGPARPPAGDPSQARHAAGES